MRSEDNTFRLKNSGNNKYYLNNILDMNNASLVDKSTFRTGIKGKTYYGLNLLDDKALLKEEKTITDYIEESVFLGNDTHFETGSDDLSSDVKFVGLSSTTSIQNKMNNKFRLAFEQINKRLILCAGYLDRYVGKIIYISEKSGSPLEMQNIPYSGSWLIKKIVHKYVAGEFAQKMTIIKNGLSETSAGSAKVKHIKPKKRNA